MIKKIPATAPATPPATATDGGRWLGLDVEYTVTVGAALSELKIVDGMLLPMATSGEDKVVWPPVVVNDVDVVGAVLPSGLVSGGDTDDEGLPVVMMDVMMAVTVGGEGVLFAVVTRM